MKHHFFCLLKFWNDVSYIAGLNIYFWLSFIPAIVSPLTFFCPLPEWNDLCIWCSTITCAKACRGGWNKTTACSLLVGTWNCRAEGSTYWITSKATRWIVLVWKTEDTITTDTVYIISGQIPKALMLNSLFNVHFKQNKWKDKKICMVKCPNIDIFVCTECFWNGNLYLVLGEIRRLSSLL